MSKTERLLAIQKLIGKQDIRTQEELLILLQNEGFTLTQATLSRDLKILKISRIAGSSGNYVYAIPGDKNIEKPSAGVDSLSGSINSIDFSGNLVVIKTFPGFATGLASEIDRKDVFGMIGSVAGDDTIIIVLNEDIKKDDFINSLLVKIPGLGDKIASFSKFKN